METSERSTEVDWSRDKDQRCNIQDLLLASGARLAATSASLLRVSIQRRSLTDTVSAHAAWNSGRNVAQPLHEVMEEYLNTTI